MSDSEDKKPAEPQKRKLLDPFEQPSRRIVRFSMLRELDDLQPDCPLPFGYRLESWCEPLLPAFAAAMAISFSDSPDIEAYPDLASREGCILMLKDIATHPGHLSGASWLVFFNREPCAIVMTGLTDDRKTGQIRLIGVAPRHREIEVGSHLLNKSLWGLRDRKLKRALVKVNRANRGAVIFFRKKGFQVESSQEYL